MLSFGNTSLTDLGPGIWTIIACVLTWFLWRKRPHNAPPGHNGLPFLGSILSLRGYREKVLSRWCKQYGPIYMIKLGFKDTIVINSVDIAYEALVKKDCFNDRFVSSSIFCGGKGLFTINFNDFHKEQRYFSSKILRKFGMGKFSLESQYMKLTGDLCDKVDGMCGKSGISQPFDMESMLYELTGNIISYILFGHGVEMNKENEHLTKILFHLKVQNTVSFLEGFVFIAPFLRHLPVFSKIWADTIAVKDDLENAAKKEIKQHKETWNPKEPRDFVDSFLDQIEEAKKKKEQTVYNKEQDNGEQETNKEQKWEPLSSFDEEQLIGLIRDFFLAGADTGSNVLLWIILFLCKYPEAQQKMQSEIDRVYGNEGLPKFSEMSSVPYVRAVIQEVQRSRPIAPLVPHMTSRGGNLAGYDIRKGSVILLNMWEFHNNEKVWPEPEKFLPERHLDQKGEFLDSPNMLAYGLGPRNCVGQQLAQMELFLTTVCLFQKFRFSIRPDDFPDMKGDSSVALRTYPYKVVAERRSGSLNTKEE